MKTINKVFLILLVSLAASPLFAQNDLSSGYGMPAAINTFVQKVNGAGDLTATVQSADGGYVTVSRIDNASFFVRKIKASGQKKWERRLNLLDPIDNFASINGIAQTTDGGFVLVGQSGWDYLAFDSGSEATLVKLRPNGTVAWKKSFRVSGQVFSRFSSVIATLDGGVIAIGAIAEARVYAPYLESLVVSFTATGDVVWAKSFVRIAAVPYVPFRPLITSTATPDKRFHCCYPN